ncbi:hypothetical protein GBAR_LOCUS20854 [Geodia barretti]|uniref:Uncharacterized protein n=1 Tax=Geodia barretti TaxID=519541 RepID=A0AA35X2B5_GEOBA|nr:hypothetical protein GBAR_LOCUS20854 [Geodia barretti]
MATLGVHCNEAALRQKTHPDSNTSDAILKKVGTFEATEEKPDCTQLDLPANVNVSGKFKHQFNQWMNVHLSRVFGGFQSAFIPELRQMLNECLADKTNQIVQGRRNIEDMMSSITRVAKATARDPVIKSMVEHLQSIIKVAQTSAQCSKATENKVPILEFPGSSVNDQLFLLNLFTSVDDQVESADIERCLMTYVPVTHVQVGIMKAGPNQECANCEASPTTIMCASCEQKFCDNCPLYSIKAPRIGINSPCPICQQCTTKLALKDAEDWISKALDLIRSREEGCMKASMACVLIALHTTEALPLANMKAVARELLNQGFQEQALLLFSVIKELSSLENDVFQFYYPKVKALQEISPWKPWRENWLLTLAPHEQPMVHVPHLSRVSKEITKYTSDIEHKERAKYEALVYSYICELQKAWKNRDIPKMLNIVDFTEVVNEDALILRNGIKAAMKALDIFLGEVQEYIQRLHPEEQCTIHFFQGYAQIYSSEVQKGLDLIERAVWSGYCHSCLLEATSNLVVFQLAYHPSVRNYLVKECKNIVKNRPPQKICFSGLLDVLGISQKDLDPFRERCWPKLSIAGINTDATRKHEYTVQQQVKEGKLNYFEAGYALIDFIPSASHPSEEMVCFFNASLWFLKDLKSKTEGDSQQIYALKKLTLKCVEEACSVARVDLHPGMQFYASRFGLAIAAEAITAAGKFATSGDSNILVEYFRSVFHNGRFCPFWKMPIVPVCEAHMLNSFTGKLHTKFMLHLQRDESNCLLTSEEVKYQLYENDIRWLCPVEEKDATHERAMEALLNEKGLTWSDISETMCSGLCPRTPEGWLIQQEHLEGNLPYVTLKGFEVNRSDSNNPGIKVTVIPVEDAKNGLISPVDIHTVLQIPMKDIFPITYSLDPPSDSQLFHPFQQIRFESSSLENSDILYTLLQTDYLLKCFSVGSDVSAKPPFRQRDCSEGLTAKLHPPHLKKVLAPIQERGKIKNKRQRFWIQADEIECSCTEKGPMLYYRIGEVKMVIRTSPMRQGLDGKLHDIEDEDPESPGSKFAKDLTENYDEISKYYPIFGRLKELCKLQFFGRTTGSIIKQMKSNITTPDDILQDIQSKARKGNETLRRTCTWVPAAVAAEEKGHSKIMSYGGVRLAPELKETPVPIVRGEKTCDFDQLTHCSPFQRSPVTTTPPPCESLRCLNGIQSQPTTTEAPNKAVSWQNFAGNSCGGSRMGPQSTETGGGTTQGWTGNADREGEWGRTMGDQSSETGGAQRKVGQEMQTERENGDAQWETRAQKLEEAQRKVGQEMQTERENGDAQWEIRAQKLEEAQRKIGQEMQTERENGDAQWEIRAQKLEEAQRKIGQEMQTERENGDAQWEIRAQKLEEAQRKVGQEMQTERENGDAQWETRAQKLEEVQRKIGQEMQTERENGDAQWEIRAQKLEEAQRKVGQEMQTERENGDAQWQTRAQKLEETAQGI